MLKIKMKLNRDSNLLDYGQNDLKNPINFTTQDIVLKIICASNIFNLRYGINLMAGPTFKVVYNYKFGWNELVPLMDAAPLVTEDITKMLSNSALVEPISKNEKEESEVLAEAKTSDSGGTKLDSESGDQEQIGSYTLTYYNPETHKAEILSFNTKIKTKDYVKRIIEEATASRSAFPVYSLVASPILLTIVDQAKLQQILNEREYGTPPPFGAAPMAKIKKPDPDIIVAVDTKQAAVESERRKLRTESAIDREISQIGSAMLRLERGESPSKAMSVLGPLTKARFLTALRKGKINKSELISLLERDVSFLKETKDKLKSIGTADLINLVRTLGRLKEKNEK